MTTYSICCGKSILTILSWSGFCFWFWVNFPAKSKIDYSCRRWPCPVPEKHASRRDRVSVPPRSCPWYRQHLHFHRRSQTFSWMWQSTLMTKPVLCSRAGFLMHWKRERKQKRRIRLTDWRHMTQIQTESSVVEWKSRHTEADRSLAV